LLSRKSAAIGTTQCHRASAEVDIYRPLLGADQADLASSVKAFMFSEVTRNTGPPEDFLTNGSKYEIVKSQGESQIA
jgi:hypothetical protein